jgi:DNA-binding CsgD family transcriptional regulator
MLLERDTALATVAVELAAASAGQGRVVLLRGEAGIGKTTVVDAVTGAVPAGVRSICGGCDPLSTPFPMGPIIECAAQLGADGIQVQAAINDRAGPGPVAAAWADSLARFGPLLWVVEDLHWADGASLDILRYLIRRCGRWPVLILLTYRDDEIGPLHPLTSWLGDLAGCCRVTRIDLPPLSRAGVEILAASHPGVRVRELLDITGGNPFLVTETLACGLVDRVPAAVSEAVLGRIARCSPAARATAGVVAVLGPDATTTLVEAVAPEAAAGLEECLAAGILRVRGRAIEFRHKLARRAAYSAIPDHRRRELHARAVTAIAITSSRPETLAYLAFHAEQATDTEAVLLYAPAAASQAARLGAHLQAADQYARALRHADTVSQDTRAEWHERLAFSAYLCGLGKQAAEAIDSAVALRHRLGDPLREGDDLRWLSHLLYPIAPLAEVRAAAQRSAALLEPFGPTPGLARSYANLTQLGTVTYDRAAVAKYGPQAMRLGRLVGDDAPLVHAAIFQAVSDITATERGWDTFEAAWHTAMSVPKLAEYAGIAGVVSTLVAMQHRDLQRLESYAEKSARFCREHNLPGFALLIRGAAAAGMVARGHYAEAEAVATEIIDQPELSPLHLLWPRIVVALVKARTGRGGDIRLLDDALTWHDPDDLFRTGVVWAARIECAWLAGDQFGARRDAAHALEYLTPDTDGSIVGAIARWAAIAGVPVFPLPRPATGPYAHELAGDFDAAAERWDRLGCPYEAAIARLHTGTDTGTHAALRAFEDLGAYAAVDRARQFHRDRQRRSSTRIDPDGLTLREREIAALLVASLSDREIARRLFISPKTVGHHVSAILAKLDVATRADVAGRLTATCLPDDPDGGMPL